MNPTSFPRVALLTLGTAVALGLTVLATSGWLADSALTANAAAQGPRNLTVLVGAGQDTSVVFGFFPSTVRVRVGDTVTWRMNDDDLHTVTFTAGVNADPAAGGEQHPLGPGGEMIPGLIVPRPADGPPGVMLNPQLAFPTRAPRAPVETYSGTGYFNSGILSKQPAEPGAPPNDTFALRFDTPGTYPYLSLILPDRMLGTVEVVPAGADAPDQAAIDAQANAEMGPLLALVQKAKAQGQALQRSDPGPGGSTIWYVRAGNSDFQSGDQRPHLMEFSPRDITVNAGDTVVWGSTLFHSVSFTPSAPLPDLVIPVPQPAGPPQLTVNPQVLNPAKPAPVFDSTQYYNSGLLGPIAPGGFSWALTFDRPGTFEYACLVHAGLGMKGTVTVVPR
jgi:plastocyanin